METQEKIETTSLEGILGQDKNSVQESRHIENSEKEAEKVETKPEPTSEAADNSEKDSSDEDENDSHPVPRKALISERKKRQEVERRLAEIEARYSERDRIEQMRHSQSQQQPQQNQQQVDPSDLFFSDPTNYIEHKINAARTADRLVMSQEMMRATHQDYDKIEEVFVEAAKTNPALQAGLARSQNPARYAYETGKALLDLKDVGSLDQLREKIRAEERAKAEEEFRKSSSLNAANKTTTSSAGARGQGALNTPEFSRTPLSDIARGTGI